jgi:hypothetical protein
MRAKVKNVIACLMLSGRDSVCSSLQGTALFLHRLLDVLILCLHEFGRLLAKDSIPISNNDKR